MKIINVTFVLPSLAAGGAERVMSFVAQNLDKSKFNPTLLIVGFENESQYEIHGINVVYLNESRVLKAIPKLFSFLRKNKPDIAISAIGHLNTALGLLSIFFIKTKFIAREVNVISVLKNYSNTKPSRILNLLYLISNRLLDKIVCQSSDMANDLISNYSVNPEKIVIINNPITKKFELKSERINSAPQIFQFITIGRLAKQKGHIRILKALREINFPFHYTIIGDGPEKQNVFRHINNFGLTEHVTHIPFTKDVQDYLSKSDIFLQGSYVEGFPNALIESCAVGTPVVAFKAPGGIDEIITDGMNGYMAVDQNDFVEKINLLAQRINNFSPSTVRNAVYSKYDSSKIIQQYEDLFKEILDR